MATETNKSNEDFYLINDGRYRIEICDDHQYYILYCWAKGVSVWMDRDEVYEFMEVMTNEENQKKMKEEMGVIRMIDGVEKQIEEQLERDGIFYPADEGK
jgi:hypothetical protein